MHLKLIYFDFPFWRAEVSRLALHLGGVPFEDVRPDREAFRALKASGSLPYGQLPVLDVDGVRIAQAVTIIRFCGQLAGLYPREDLLAAARVDELLDACTDITLLLGPSMRAQDATERAELRRRLAEEIFPRWLGFLEKRLTTNAPSPYFVGDQLSVADLAIWRILGWLTGGILDGIPTDLLEPHAALQAHYERIDAHPGVRDWMSRYA